MKLTTVVASSLFRKCGHLSSFSTHFAAWSKDFLKEGCWTLNVEGPCGFP